MSASAVHRPRYNPTTILAHSVAYMTSAIASGRLTRCPTCSMVYNEHVYHGGQGEWCKNYGALTGPEEDYNT